MAQVHRPFDTLFDDAAGGYEQRFLSAVLRGERVALIGASGSGKSSMTEYVLNRPEVEGVAALRVRIGMQTDVLMSDPAMFPRLLVSTVAKQLEDDKAMQKVDRQVRGGVSRRPVKVSLGGGIPWMKGDLAVELGGVVAEPLQGEEVLDRAVYILELIKARGLMPTLVLDDTDQWIRRPGIGNDLEPRIASFFGPTLRMIVDHLPAACVIAVHTEYIGTPHYERAQEFLDARITLPTLSNKRMLGAIITKRARVASGEPGVRTDDVIEGEGLRRLFEHYEEKQSVRRELSVLHDALVRACDAGVNVIGAEQVVSAIAG